VQNGIEARSSFLVWKSDVK